MDSEREADLLRRVEKLESQVGAVLAVARVLGLQVREEQDAEPEAAGQWVTQGRWKFPVHAGEDPRAIAEFLDRALDEADQPWRPGPDAGLALTALA